MSSQIGIFVLEVSDLSLKNKKYVKKCCWAYKLDSWADGGQII